MKRGLFEQLKWKKMDVRKLAYPRTTLKEKRRVLRQKGGFVTLLLVPVIQLFPQQQ